MSETEAPETLTENQMNMKINNCYFFYLSILLGFNGVFKCKNVLTFCQKNCVKANALSLIISQMLLNLSTGGQHGCIDITGEGYKNSPKYFKFAFTKQQAAGLHLRCTSGKIKQTNKNRYCKVLQLLFQNRTCLQMQMFHNKISSFIFFPT